MAKVDSPSVQQALDQIQAATGRRERNYGGQVTIVGQDPVLASRHRFGELMAATQASLGMNLGDIWQQRGGEVQSVGTSVEQGIHQHHGIAFLRQNGNQIGFTGSSELSGQPASHG